MNCNSMDNQLFQTPTCNKLQQLANLGFNYNSMCDFNLILKDAETCAMNQECIKAQMQKACFEEYQCYYQQLEVPVRQNMMYASINRADLNNYECYTGAATPNENSTVSQEMVATQGGSKKKWLPAGKKADKSDPELRNLSNSYFWERRNIFLQMLDSYHDDEVTLIKATPKNNKTLAAPKKARGSIYRGVSKNKAKWQVMIMGNFKKMYFGAIEDEKEAALFYDKLAIVSHGIKARTNFNYTRRDIIEILNEEGLSKAWAQ